MSMYTVHVRASDLDRPTAAERAVYVREGFSWGAFLFAPLWCLFRRSWLGLACWVVAAALIIALGRYLDIEPAAISVGLFALHVLFGFEAAQLRRRSLTRRGYLFADIVGGHGSSEAEIAFATRRGAQFEHAAAQALQSSFVSASRSRPLVASESYGLSPLGGGS